MKEIIRQIWPLLIGLVFLWFIKNEIAIFIALLVIIGITFKIDYHKQYVPQE